jgi:hypothetical protein
MIRPDAVETAGAGIVTAGDAVLIGWGKLGPGGFPSLANCYVAEVLAADADGVTLLSPRGKVWTVAPDSRQIRGRHHY